MTTPQAKPIVPGCTVEFTPVAACLCGDVVQLPDGRPGVCTADIAAAAKGSAYVDGLFAMVKHTAGALLAGGDVFWDVSAGHAQHAPDSGTNDFWAGTVSELETTVAAATAEVKVNLGHRVPYVLDLGKDGREWTETRPTGTTGTGLSLPGAVYQATVLATNEAQARTLISNHGVLGSAKPIFEARVALYDAGSGVMDVDFGLATGVHATDFESVTAFAAFHFDGGLDVKTHSDDNTTDRAPVDSTIDAVDDTFAEYWIDARDDTDVKFYVDGVLVDTSASKRILTAALASTFYAVHEIEKTASTETGESRVSRMRVRCGPNE